MGEGLRCLGFVPEDAAVRTAVAAQQPLAAAAEHSLAVQALTRMARSLVRELTPEGADRCGLFTLADDKVNPAEADIRK
ncbi:MAG TPA: hypothetical protein PK112_01485 [candidate division Zixibacteria bacterium]|nr:hypothetical protein [candidate division Zixibacteria bacterium]